MEFYYSWRYQREMPFLNETEWQEISPFLTNSVRAIKDYRTAHKRDLATAQANCKPEATRKFFEMTGVPDIHFEQIYYLRRSDFGKECLECGHLMRTPKA